MGRGVRFLRGDKESFRSIDVDKNGVHWVSNERHVFRFRTDERGMPVSVAEAFFEGFDALTIYGLAEDPGGGLLFALDGGVGFLSPAARAAAAPRVRADARFDVLRERLVTSIHRDLSDAVWAVSPLGVYRLARGAREAQRVAVAGNPWIGALDSAGSLWVANRQGDLHLIDTATSRVTPVELPLGRRVEFVAPAPDGGAVATFENGASAFFSVADAAGGVKVEPIEGLSWLSVQSLQKMGEHYLAAHGGDRLSQIRLDPTRVEQTILTSADLEDSDFRYLSLREGRAGQIWFTLLNGIGLLDPPNAPPAPSRLRMDPELESFGVGPRPNLVDLHVELSDPVAPRKARYRYRLLGESEEWSAWSADPHIPLANIAPGEYRLEVEAEDRYGRQAAPVAVSVTAAAHPWETWWFRVAVLFLLLGAGYALSRFRVRAVEHDRLKLEAAVRAGRADLEIANARLQELSITDVLTGLRNRRYFAEVVEDELRLLRRRFDERGAASDPNRDAVFFLLDLDHFKSVNDLFGHAGGDAVLQETARRLQALLRRTDRLIRWGGEEFLILSLDCQRAEAGDMAARMMAAISQTPFAVGPPRGINVSTSVGFSAYPFSPGDADQRPEDVVRLADRALYRAKQAGRNRAVGISAPSDQPQERPAARRSEERLVDLGFSVIFTVVEGPQSGDGLDLISCRDGGSHRRLG